MRCANDTQLELSFRGISDTMIRALHTPYCKPGEYPIDESPFSPRPSPEHTTAVYHAGHFCGRPCVNLIHERVKRLNDLHVQKN
eukprot:SAG31_NODE_2714_length_5203_cov_14.538793_5_plen_84_part_00